jgi:hypothetical protein
MIFRKSEIFRVPEQHTSSWGSSSGGYLGESLILRCANWSKNCQMNVKISELLIIKEF